MKFKNYINPYSKSNRIYSQNDIANMPVKEAFKREREIVAQDDRIGVPSDMELRNSENVIWVEEYRRDDGTEVKGHWRSKPGRGSIVSTQEDDYGIIEENPKTSDDIMDKSEDEQWVDFGMDITDIIFGDSKIAPLITLLAPLIRFLLGKFFSDEEDDSENTRDDSENTRDDSTNTQTPATQSPQDKTPTQNNPTDKNQEQEPTQDKPDIGTTTGGASEVKEYSSDDIPDMTTYATLQEIAAKNNPIANNYPEQEYYKISLNLQKVRETGKVPNWMQEHNDVRTLNEIGNKELAQKIREKVVKEAKTNNDIETVHNPNNVFVITAKPGSNLTKLVVNDSSFKAEIENKLSDIKNGKYEKSNFTYIFQNKKPSEKDYLDHFSTGYTIGKCDVHNVKLESDGYVSAIIIDYYDFSKGGVWFNNNANIQQQNKKLENYALVIPIRIKIKK